MEGEIKLLIDIVKKYLNKNYFIGREQG